MSAAAFARPSTSRTPAALDTDYDHLFKLLVVGDSGVGKSCLTRRFADDFYRDNFVPTIGVDFLIRSLHTTKGKKVKLQIWDTAGQDRFRAITASYYRGGNGIVLCYDTTDVNSFRSLTSVWLKEIASYAREDVRVMIVGTKADLSDARRKARSLEAGAGESKDKSAVGAGGGRAVSRATRWGADSEEEWDEIGEATALAEELGVPLLRCSAKTGKGVEELFTSFSEQLIADRAERVAEGGADPRDRPGLGIRLEDEGLFSRLGCFC